MKKITTSILTGILSSIGSLSLTASVYTSMSTWNDDSWEPTSNWVISQNGAEQTINNPGPTVWYSDFNAAGQVINGTMGVNTTADDDFIGLVIGFTPGDLSAAHSNQFLLIDWKQSASTNSWGFASRGMAISLVSGLPDDVGDFWSHTGNVEEITRATTLGNVGWANNSSYNFSLEYSESMLEFSINDVLQFSLSAADIPGNPENLPNGRFGFYSFSQQNSAFSITEVNAIPELSAHTLAAGFAAALLVALRRRSC